MDSNPLLESKIREIQGRAEVRRNKRADAVADALDLETERNAAAEETRTSVSPAEVTAAQRHHELVEHYAGIHERKLAREKNDQRNADVLEMEKIKAEWDKSETTPGRRARIVSMYAALYSKWSTVVTPEMVLAYWLKEKRAAVLQKIFEVATQ
jgi:hypothetical protein